MKKEIWKDVPSCPGMKASSYGRILLPKCTRKMPNGGMREYNPAPTFGIKTKASKTARHKYYGIRTRKYGNVKVHRAVCEAFHGKPKQKNMVVIHIDENSLNNLPSNLKWGTQKENLNCKGFIEYCKGRVGDKSPRTKGMKNRIV